jgi:hypothetical protein
VLTGSLKGRCLRNRRMHVIFAGSVRVIWFLGSVHATAYDDNDSLQRLRCYDDDMVDPSGSSNANIVGVRISPDTN